jgi:hypothetical protein
MVHAADTNDPAPVSQIVNSAYAWAEGENRFPCDEIVAQFGRHEHSFFEVTFYKGTDGSSSNMLQTVFIGHHPSTSDIVSYTKPRCLSLGMWILRTYEQQSCNRSGFRISSKEAPNSG